MRCGKWAVEISKWHEGELHGKRETDLRLHLASCRRCQDLEAKLRAVNALLIESPELPVPDFLSQRITASVSEVMRHRSRGKVSGLFGFLSYRLRAVAMAGMLMIALFIGGLAGHNIVGFMELGPAQPAYDLLTLGEIGSQGRPVAYGLIWQDHGEGGRQ